jgi:hypothetical protein
MERPKHSRERVMHVYGVPTPVLLYSACTFSLGLLAAVLPAALRRADRFKDLLRTG